MNLFHPRVLQKTLAFYELQIPESQAQILCDWRDSITSGAMFKQKETALHGHFIQKILIEVLGYTGFGSTPEWTLQREQHVGKGSVDVALGRFSDKEQQITAVCELKGAKTKDLDAIMAGRHKSPVQQAWEYATDAPVARWVLVCNYVELRLYAVGYGRQAYEVWTFETLTDPREYARFQLLLSARNLLGERTRALLLESDKADKEITNALYQDYKSLRQHLIASLRRDNPQIDTLALIAYAQIILDRVLFIAFAEDKGLLPKHTLARAYEHCNQYNPRPIWENFQGLFRAINEGSQPLNIPAYDGGLFRPEALPPHLQVHDEVCRAFKDLGNYDFASEVSVTILGHIFEQSITDLEALQAEARGETPEGAGKRKKEGVVYTPDAITRFIVEKTLGGYVAEQFDALWQQWAGRRTKSGEWKSTKHEIVFWRAYQERLRTLKVVDPACGSGAFLVAAFEFLHEEYTRVNARLAELTGQPDLFDLDKEILSQNLYGVDINAESIEITKLSLWLKTAKYGKQLNSLDHNLRVGNSLIDNVPQTARLPESQDANEAVCGTFGWRAAFPEVFAQGGFDVVLGNPPYVRQEFISHLKPALQQQYVVYHGVADLYTYFYERGLKLLKPGGKLGYISSSTFFKTGSGQNLRRFLAQQATIECVVDFGDLQIFEGVTTYPAILVLANTQPSEDHELQFLQLKSIAEDDLVKVFSNCVAIMPQTELNEESWRLEADLLVQLRNKIIEEKKNLKGVYGSPYRGVLTGFNEAFVVDQKTKDELIQRDPKSEKVIKPFLAGKDLERWYKEQRDSYLIFTRRGIEIDQYPAIKQYLSSYRECLEPKPKNWPSNQQWKGRKPGPYQWFEIQDTVGYYEEFEKLKIVYPDISQQAEFSLYTEKTYFANTVYFLPTDDPFLLALLNSNVIWFYWRGISNAIRGGFFRLFTQYVETTPIPDATDAQKASIANLARRCQETAEARYAAQEAMRRRIPDLCPADREPKLNTKLQHWWTLDFKTFRAEVKKCFRTDILLAERNEWDAYLSAERGKIEEFSRTLDALEAELNQQVYALFDLTADEIALIEEEIAQ